MLFRASRDRRKADRWLDLRMLLFGIGGGTAMVAMIFDVGWLVYVAIGVLFVAVILGLLARRTAAEPD